MLRCVLVDDSSRFADAARTVLERQGVVVVGVASNGIEAAERVARLQPDVVLVDIDLGEESGFDVARSLQNGARRGPAPIILISTHAEQDYADLIADSPAVGFIPKSGLSGDAVRNLLEADDQRGRGASGPRTPR